MQSNLAYTWKNAHKVLFALLVDAGSFLVYFSIEQILLMDSCQITKSSKILY